MRCNESRTRLWFHQYSTFQCTCRQKAKAIVSHNYTRHEPVCAAQGDYFLHVCKGRSVDIKSQLKSLWAHLHKMRNTETGKLRCRVLQKRARFRADNAYSLGTIDKFVTSWLDPYPHVSLITQMPLQTMRTNR